MNLNDIKDDFKKKVNAKPRSIEKSLKQKLVSGALTTLMTVSGMAAIPQEVDAATFVSKGKVLTTYKITKEECKYWYNRHYNSKVVTDGQMITFTGGALKMPALFATPAAVAAAGSWITSIPMDRFEQGMQGNGLQIKVIKMYNKKNGETAMFLWDVERLK